MPSLRKKSPAPDLDELAENDIGGDDDGKNLQRQAKKGAIRGIEVADHARVGIAPGEEESREVVAKQNVKNKNGAEDRDGGPHGAPGSLQSREERNPAQDENKEGRLAIEKSYLLPVKKDVEGADGASGG